MKIHIIGGSGSGKSFIASKLGERFSIPVLDLDDIFWDREAAAFNTRADPEKRDSELAAFSQNPC